MEKKSLFKLGLKDGYPIGLGYFPLAFTLGIGASNLGLALPASISMALLSFTGVGQLTTMDLISTHERYIGIFLALLVINLRNIVLSLSMAGKLDPKVGIGKKLFIAMGNTDEIFALTIRKEGKLQANYLFGVIALPYFAWIAGIIIGGIAGDILPHQVTIALGMALYGMLISAIVPAVKESKPVLYVAILSGVLSCVFKWINVFFSSDSIVGKIISVLFSKSGVIIIGSLLSAMIVASKFPTKKKEDE